MVDSVTGPFHGTCCPTLNIALTNNFETNGRYIIKGVDGCSFVLLFFFPCYLVLKHGILQILFPCSLIPPAPCSVVLLFPCPLVSLFSFSPIPLFPSSPCFPVLLIPCSLVAPVPRFLVPLFLCSFVSLFPCSLAPLFQ